MDTMIWEPPQTQMMKVERNLNFSTIVNEEDEFGFSRKKSSRDPMSHRIIEKRRRDRMNNCLADLSRLVPTNYLKKGRGRIEKTEIIEMAIRHLKHLQSHPCKDPANCDVVKVADSDSKTQFKSGYMECMHEALRYVGELQGIFSPEQVDRMSIHLGKHLNKTADSLNYTKSFEAVSVEDSKPGMEMDNHSGSCFLPDPPAMNGHFPFDSRSSEVPELKKEVKIDVVPVKVTSQLREMLQNPGVPFKDSIKTINNCNDSPQPVSVLVEHQNDNKQEEGYYKFKNNIKHRFHNDIRHHTSSPTDSHLSDRMSLPDEDHNNKLHVPEPYGLRHLPEERIVPNGLCSSPVRHAFSPYPSNRHSSEFSDKTPDRNVQPENGGYGAHHWDNQAETASSCGSSGSPPPNNSRNGSSSGYSTNGDNNLNSHTVLLHSPTLSPYSRTPDRRSPSPLQAGVPIFALHPKGSFYIPLTIDATLLVPYLSAFSDINPVLHPISICVNLSNNSVKVEKVSDSTYRSHLSYTINQERYGCPERPHFYPTTPPRNGCS